MPSRSATPPRKPSMMTSAHAARRRNAARPSGRFTSRQIARLLRLTVMCSAPSPFFIARGYTERPASGASRDSTLITSAPMSARYIPQIGPAIRWASSRTRTPASGGGSWGAMTASP